MSSFALLFADNWIPMPYSLRPRPFQTPRRHPRRSLTVFDLPRAIRDRIYHHALHDDAPETFRWDGRTPPHVSLGNLGLLRVCRRVYREASAILYATVHLGSDALLAKAYLRFLTPRRVQQIRNLTIFYECRRVCLQEEGPGECLDWMAIFELLRKAGRCLEHVVVRFDPCCGNLGGWKRYLQRRCRLEWDEKMDRFWCGLKTLTTVREIRFEGEGVPEYFVHRHTKQLGWQMDGVVENSRCEGRVVPFTTFCGRLVNPKCLKKLTEMSEDGRKLLRSGRKVEGDVSVKEGRGFWNLPLEIRRMIYDDVSEWVYKPFWPNRPGRYNTGAALLHVSKQMCADALPSIYRTFRIYGGSPLATLNKLGANLAFVRRLETHFSCFCPWGGSSLQLNNGTIYAVRDPEGQDEWSRPPLIKDWYPTDSVVIRYKDEWYQVTRRVQAQGCLSELAVTYLSCNRSSFFETAWAPALTADPAEFFQYKHRCRCIENYFNVFLTGFSAVNKISLGGNVPPSMAMRLARPWSARGRSLKGMSRAMEEYLRDSKARFQEWKMRAPNDSAFLTEKYWMNPTVYPPLEYNSARGQAPHFVLMRNETARNRWSQCVELENGAELGKDGDAVAKLTLPKLLGEISRDMDLAKVVFDIEEDWG